MAAQLLSEREPYLSSTPLGSSLVGSVCLDDKDATHTDRRQTKHCKTLCTRVLWSPYNDLKINVTNDPCFHTLCTAVDPRLNTPIYV